MDQRSTSKIDDPLKASAPVFELGNIYPNLQPHSTVITPVIRTPLPNSPTHFTPFLHPFQGKSQEKLCSKCFKLKITKGILFTLSLLLVLGAGVYSGTLLLSTPETHYCSPCENNHQEMCCFTSLQQAEQLRFKYLHSFNTEHLDIVPKGKINNRPAANLVYNHTLDIEETSSKLTKWSVDFTKRVYHTEKEGYLEAQISGLYYIYVQVLPFVSPEDANKTCTDVTKDAISLWATNFYNRRPTRTLAYDGVKLGRTVSLWAVEELERGDQVYVEFTRPELLGKSDKTSSFGMYMISSSKEPEA